MFKPAADFRALVADASANMAGLVADMLHSLKIRVVDEAHSLSSLEKALSTQVYRLLLIDADLAPNDDLALIRKLRQTDQHPNRDMPIIMMAASPSAPMIAAARDAGVTEFLRKPFAAQHIALRLEAIQSAPREFVAAGNYAGPDRRRRTVEGAPGRRAVDTSKGSA